MKTSTLKRLAFKSIPWVFYGLLLVFLVIYLQSIDLAKLQNVDIAWQYVLIATGLGLGFRYWGAYIWVVLLRSLGATNVRLSRSLVYIYAKSWLGRYIPGTAPWILGKIYFASKQGISKNKLAVSSLLEGALQIIVQFLFALALLAFDPRLDVIPGEVKGIILIGIVGCIVALIPTVFNRLIAAAYRLIKKKQFSTEHYASSRTISKGFGLYVVGALMSSLSLFFIAKAFYPELSYDQLFFVMGVGTLAGAVSMVAVFAPSGIGVREGIQLVLLSIIMPTEIALVVTIATRLWSVLVDGLFFGLAWLMRTKL